MAYKKPYFVAKDEKGLYFITNSRRCGILEREALLTSEKNARERLGKCKGTVVQVELVEVKEL